VEAAGQPVTFTATVTQPSSYPTPTGTVSFEETSTVTGLTSVLATVPLDSSAVATFTTSSLPAGGNDPVAAVYNGDSNYFPEVSLYVIEQVGPRASTTTTVGFSADPVAIMHSYTVSAAVASARGNVPTGTVVFYSEGGEVGTASLNASGVATIAAPVPSVAGQVTWQAVYDGDAGDIPSTSAVVSETTGAGTTTAIAFSSDPVAVGHTYTVEATVKASGSPSPEGTVVFYSEGGEVGTASLNASGVATISAPDPTAAGQVTWQAVYGGSTADDSSMSAVASETAVA
jgi:hypothetical protein